MRNLVPIVLFLLFSLTISKAQNFYVRSDAKGNNNGSSWDNAFTSLPSVLIRGATYYIADGFYSGYSFDDIANGGQYITIKKAIKSDHGENAGWQDTFGDSVAVFLSELVFYTGHYIFDGQVGGGPGSWGSGHGFEVIGNWDSTIRSGVIVMFFDKASNIEFRHTKLRSNKPFTGFGTGFQGRNNSNILISHCYLPELWGVPLKTRHVSNYIVEYSYFFRNDNTSLWHAEFNSDIGSDYMTFRYNIFEEIDGTAVFAGVNGSGDDPQDYWEIYGNICISSVAFVQYYYQAGDDENLARYWKIFNNSIIGPRGGGLNFQYAIDIEIVNNIWYNFYPTEYIDAKGDTINPEGKFRFYYTNNSTHNSLYDVYYSFQLSPNFRMGQDVENFDTLNNEKIAGDPFRNSINKDFYLAESKSPGKFLNVRYIKDMYGNIRGLDGVWDRGAIEFDTSHLNNIIADTIIIFDTICNNESVYLQGDFQTSSGIFYDVFKNKEDKDSLVITNLTVNAENEMNIDISICEGESYYIGGANQFVSGTYYDTLINAHGCDSIITTNLSVNICNEINQAFTEYKIKISPIPTEGILYVEFDDYQYMELFNLFGEHLFRTSDKTIDISDYMPGIYFLVIVDNHGKRIPRKILHTK